MICEYCGHDAPADSPTDSHEECEAERRRRLHDGLCMWCGGLVDRPGKIIDCSKCQATGLAYSGYPGGP